MSDLLPTSGHPEFDPRQEHDPDDCRPDCAECPEAVRWNLSFGACLSFGPETTDGPLTVTLNLSDDALARGIVHRQVTPEQVLTFAQHLLDLIGASPVLTLPRTPGPEDRAQEPTEGLPQDLIDAIAEQVQSERADAAYKLAQAAFLIGYQAAVANAGEPARQTYPVLGQSQEDHHA